MGDCEAINIRAAQTGNAGQAKNHAAQAGDFGYVLITPAKNEAKLIRGVLQSIANQTVKPVQWIIVDDGSTDETAAIVEEFAQRFSFIRLVRLQPNQRRNFSSKAAAFKAGVDAISVDRYSFLGNLDADMTVEPTYYETVLKPLRAEMDLGISGGKVFTTLDGNFVCNDNTEDSVGGAVQLFRRECYEEIGGYGPLPFGGIDAAAEIVARAKGWRVRKVDVPAYEHRTTGSAQSSPWRGRYRDGWKFHSLGYGTAFFFCRCLMRLNDSPRIIGSVVAMIGFMAARLSGSKICLPQDVAAFLRAEQQNKLRTIFARFVPMMPRTGHNHQA